MRLAIFGSRDFPDLDLVRRLVHELPSGTVVVSGDAGRVALAAQEAARDCGLEGDVRRPNWAEDGKRGRLVMNEELILGADEVLVFWDLERHGTANSVRLARGAGRPVRVIGPDGSDVSDRITGVLALTADYLERHELRRQRGRIFVAAMAARRRGSEAREGGRPGAVLSPWPLQDGSGFAHEP